MPSQEQDPPHTLVSSPGKVLLAGGYLVLSPAYPGLVISTDSRFYSLVKPGGANTHTHTTPIHIHSPQFTDAHWTFELDTSTWGLTLSKESAESQYAGKSPFLCLSLVYALGIALQKCGQAGVQSRLAHGLDIWILADNDFYSQRKGGTPPTTSYLRELPAFNPLNCAISQVHKTGLGSSAALTTSLVSALLIHLGVARADNDSDLALLHNASQLAHCAAQGKVGSGFDVSSAVWGSQIYRRFDAGAIRDLLSDIPSVAVQGQEPLSLNTLPDLLTPLNPLNPLWQPSPLSATRDASSADAHPTAYEGLHSVASSTNATPRPAPLDLPPRISLLLADVDAGSNTPSLVSKVNEWKARKPEWAAQLYSVLATSNQSLADALLSLKLAHDADPERYNADLDDAGRKKSKSWPAPTPTDDSTSARTHLTSARNALRSIRAGMRQLGQLSKAPIEPDEMGRLIQTVIDDVPGVIGGGVPGAGGYDALYLLFVDEPGRREEVERVLVSAKEQGLSVGVLLSSAGEARVQGSARALGGLRVERVDEVKGLRERVEGQ